MAHQGRVQVHVSRLPRRGAVGTAIEPSQKHNGYYRIRDRGDNYDTLHTAMAQSRSGSPELTWLGSRESPWNRRRPPGRTIHNRDPQGPQDPGRLQRPSIHCFRHCKLNFRKLSVEERKWLKKIAEKSDLLKNPKPQRGRR